MLQSRIFNIPTFFNCDKGKYWRSCPCMLKFSPVFFLFSFCLTFTSVEALEMNRLKPMFPVLLWSPAGSGRLAGQSSHRPANRNSAAPGSGIDNVTVCLSVPSSPATLLIFQGSNDCHFPSIHQMPSDYPSFFFLFFFFFSLQAKRTEPYPYSDPATTCLPTCTCTCLPFRTCLWASTFTFTINR